MSNILVSVIVTATVDLRSYAFFLVLYYSVHPNEMIKYVFLMKIFMSQHKKTISYHQALHHSMSCHDYHGVPSMKLSEYLSIRLLKV